MNIGFLCLLFVFIPSISGLVHSQKAEYIRQSYEDFKRKYNKYFIDDEDDRRFGIFKDNIKRAQIYQREERGTAKYGVTRFSDLTPDEFKALYLTAMYDHRSFKQCGTIGLETVGELQESFDWRDYGAVGPVLDQDRCGSSWAFSAIGNIEGQYFMRVHRLLSLSEQQLVDCDRIDQGCAGGSPYGAFQGIQQLGGLELDADYPYVGHQDNCQSNPLRFVVSINGSVQLPEDEDQIAQYLFDHGPLSVGINGALLQYYSSGIMHPFWDNCNPAETNHAGLAVGFGTEQDVPYWIIKNSWSTLWGEEGYFRLYRGNGTCGVNEAVCSATVA